MQFLRKYCPQSAQTSKKYDRDYDNDPLSSYVDVLPRKGLQDTIMRLPSPETSLRKLTMLDQTVSTQANLAKQPRGIKKYYLTSTKANHPSRPEQLLRFGGSHSDHDKHIHSYFFD
jgi:hypothetical protein